LVAIRITDLNTDIRIATLVRRALAEVCTVPVLLVRNLNSDRNDLEGYSRSREMVLFDRPYDFLLIVCFRDITACFAYVTPCDLERSFSLFMTITIIIGHVWFPVGW